MKLAVLAATMAVAANAQEQTLSEMIAETKTLSTLATALNASAISTPLANGTTVFAPTNDAFDALAALVPNVVGYLTAGTEYSKDLLTQVLLAHVVNTGDFSEPIDSERLLNIIPEDGDSANETALNGVLTFTRDGDDVSVAAVGGVDTGAQLTDTVDQDASNGVAHLINGVIAPAGITYSSILDEVVKTPGMKGNYSLVVDALVALDAAKMFGEASIEAKAAYTVFVPSNAAFEAALIKLGLKLEELLKDKKVLETLINAHVIAKAMDSAMIVAATNFTAANDEVITLESLDLNKTDVKTLNGIVHYVNSVIIPPSLVPPGPEASSSGPVIGVAAALGVLILGSMVYYFKVVEPRELAAKEAEKTLV